MVFFDTQTGQAGPNVLVTQGEKPSEVKAALGILNRRERQKARSLRNRLRG
jgi:hypothetical protein